MDLFFLSPSDLSVLTLLLTPCFDHLKSLFFQQVLRSLSRSRSRDARGSDDSPSRGASGGATLPQVDETTSTNGSTTAASTATETPKPHGFASKIAAHLPGHHKS